MKDKKNYIVLEEDHHTHALPSVNAHPVGTRVMCLEPINYAGLEVPCYWEFELTETFWRKRRSWKTIKVWS